MNRLSAMAYELREDVIDMIVEGKAGHIGGDMSVMEILTEIYFDQMNISPDNMDDPERDKFVLSKGHSVEAYYAVLVYIPRPQTRVSAKIDQVFRLN